MKTKLLLLSATAALALASTPAAFAGEGWYLSMEGGGTQIDAVDAASLSDPDIGLPVASVRTFEFDNGWVALAAVGYGMSDWRVEFEGGYRSDTTTLAAAYELTEWSAMLNVLYDIKLSRSVALSLGAGVGGDYMNLKSSSNSFDANNEWDLAYQGIAGLSIALSKKLDFVINYRYLRISEPEFLSTVTGPAGTLAFGFDDVGKHAATLGLRYSFGVAEAPPPPPPPPSPPPPPPPPPPEPPKAPKEYIVFFGHNKSELTPEALDVIKQAAAATKEHGSANVTVIGHADRSGSDKHNIALSTKRASAVKGALVTEGVPEAGIAIDAKGESSPLVPTEDGVREPQNRRVNINLQ